MRAGYAEIVKYGLIMDPEFFRWCDAQGKKLLAGDKAAQIYAIRASCAYKAKVVVADEKEAGQRALLNLGHTFGHALEAVAGYGDTLLHGEAVAIGMVLAFKLSVKMGLCPESDYEAVKKHLADVGLPIASPAALTRDIDKLMALMAQDKKAEGGKLTLILAKGIGKGFIAKDVNPDDVRAVWSAK
jgi:3-dehydroquinate synthase